MPKESVEDLLSRGESPKCAASFREFRALVDRGKSLLQLKAVASSMTPGIRASWSPRSFTSVVTDAGVFDAIACNISYHFHKHGQKFGDIGRMTDAAIQFFTDYRTDATADQGLLRFPDRSLYERDGRIVTFVNDWDAWARGDHGRVSPPTYAN